MLTDYVCSADSIVHFLLCSILRISHFKLTDISEDVRNLFLYFFEEVHFERQYDITLSVVVLLYLTMEESYLERVLYIFCDNNLMD